MFTGARDRAASSIVKASKRQSYISEKIGK
jgi:hypothetical protein